MKTLFFLAILVMSAQIISMPKPLFEECSFKTIKQKTPDIIFRETIADPSNQSTLLTRAFHNKVNIYLSESFKCYFGFFDPSLIYKTVGLIGFTGWVFSIIFLISSQRWLFVFLILLIPIPSLMNFLPILTIHLYKLLSVSGLIILIYKSKSLYA